MSSTVSYLTIYSFFSHLSSVLQSECFCPLPRFMCRNQRPKVLVRRLLGDHYLMGVEPSRIGLELLQKMPQAVPLTLPPLPWEISPAQTEEDSSTEPDHIFWPSDLERLASKSEQYISGICKPTSLWYFVIVA